METEAETYFTLFFSILIAFNSHVDILFRPYSAARFFFRYHTRKSQEKQKILFYLHKKQEKTTNTKSKKFIIATAELPPATAGRILVKLPKLTTKDSDLVLVRALAGNTKVSLALEAGLSLAEPQLESSELELRGLERRRGCGDGSGDVSRERGGGGSRAERDIDKWPNGTSGSLKSKC